MSFADQIINFNSKVKFDIDLPGIEVMNPFKEKITRDVSETFYRKYFSDNLKRTFIFGINPGRFGAGITGVPFTDPIRLETKCGIKNSFKKLPELSSEFVYMFIDAMGGAEKFYSHFFITAVSPLGFTRENKNLNYYDDKMLCHAIEKFIINSIKIQLMFGANTKKCFCLGEGENFKYFQKLNSKYHFFELIIPLPHPRWVMQYRRKKVGEFVEMYLRELMK